MVNQRATHSDSDGLSFAERVTRCEAYRGSMMRAARDHTRVFDDAQDAVQDALLKVAACEHIDWSRVEGLLITVTRQICVDLFRAQVRRRWRDLSYTFTTVSASDPIERVLDRAEATWVAQHLSVLKQPDQQLLLRLADGERLSEIADAEGLKYQTAYARVRRARQRITDELRRAS